MLLRAEALGFKVQHAENGQFVATLNPTAETLREGADLALQTGPAGRDGPFQAI